MTNSEVVSLLMNSTYYEQGYKQGVYDVLDKIRSEITAIVISGQIDEHTAYIRTGEQVKQMMLNVIDKYKAESENKE